MNYLFVTLLYCMQYVCTSNASYYWRDYRGQIPPDAYEAGTDINKNIVYIGQAFIKTDPHQGIYPTRIQPGKQPYVIICGVKKPNYFIQILCSSDPDNFEWTITNSTHLHFINGDNEMVRGGIQGNTLLSIGRLKYQGETVIGKVLSGNVGRAHMWFAHHKKRVLAKSFEVLMYNDIASKIDVRISNE